MTSGVAISSFVPPDDETEAQFLPLLIGTSVVNVQVLDGDWWFGSNEFGRSGYFPSSFIKINPTVNPIDSDDADVDLDDDRSDVVSDITDENLDSIPIESYSNVCHQNIHFTGIYFPMNSKQSTDMLHRSFFFQSCIWLELFVG